MGPGRFSGPALGLEEEAGMDSEEDNDLEQRSMTVFALERQEDIAVIFLAGIVTLAVLLFV